MTRGIFLTLAMCLAATGESPCGMCHPSQAAGFARTPMGRSLTPAMIEATASFAHKASGGRLSVSPDGLRIEQGGLSATYPAVWQIGSGNHAAGFLTTIGGQLFQAPIAYYPRRNLWDVAPGYESLPHIDFNRRVTGECLFCHTGLSSQLTPITCERCHGEAEPHSLRPAKGNVVNPAKLAAAERAAVCEQCHLSGEARIAQPGRRVEDFRPGRKLEDYLAIFVSTAVGSEIKVVSHAEQLAQSKCAQRSPQLWCGTCHKVHGETVNISRTCQGCHPARAAGHPRTDAECASCHMPKRDAVDGLHTTFTDHRVRRPGRAVVSEVAPGLRAWRAGPNAERNLGLALMAAGERAGSEAYLQQSFRTLSAAYPNHPRDPELLTALGSLLFLKDQYADAGKLFLAAIQYRPAYGPYRQKLAIVLKAQGQAESARARLEEAIRLDPLDETNYHLLADLTPERRREILQRYLAIHPQHLATRKR
ncbi:MAG: tetratricopeptide repeat protein [Bryobacteraceae bacterium]